MIILMLFTIVGAGSYHEANRRSMEWYMKKIDYCGRVAIYSHNEYILNVEGISI